MTDITKAPERLWIVPGYDSGKGWLVCDGKDVNRKDVEYVRADIVKAENKRLRELIKDYGKTVQKLAPRDAIIEQALIGE